MIAAGLTAIIVLGLLDLFTGSDLSFFIFYILPISWLSWNLGLFAGFFASLLAAVVWLSAEILGGRAYEVPWAPAWNMMTRLCLFLFVAVILDKFKTNLKRQQFLEELFFHDLLNLVGSMRGFSELLQNKEQPNKQDIAQMIGDTAEKIINEIETQKVLIESEKGVLVADKDFFQVRPLLESLVCIYQQQSCARNRQLILSDMDEDCLLWSDRTILTRILGNLIKNALEATPLEGTVKLSCWKQNGETIFSVNNLGEIPHAIRKHVMRKKFTTKGRGRGFGLHSIQLLMNVIGGKLTFTSNPEEGTTFLVKLPDEPKSV